MLSRKELDEAVYKSLKLLIGGANDHDSLRIPDIDEIDLMDVWAYIIKNNYVYGIELTPGHVQTYAQSLKGKIAFIEKVIPRPSPEGISFLESFESENNIKEIII